MSSFVSTCIASPEPMLLHDIVQIVVRQDKGHVLSIFVIQIMPVQPCVEFQYEEGRSRGNLETETAIHNHIHAVFQH